LASKKLHAPGVKPEEEVPKTVPVIDPVLTSICPLPPPTTLKYKLILDKSSINWSKDAVVEDIGSAV
jgi:hypothetical protein